MMPSVRSQHQLLLTAAIAAAAFGLPGAAIAQVATPPAPNPVAPAPAPVPTPAPTVSRESDSSLLSSLFGPPRPAAVRQRLTRVPDMFGDAFLHGQTLTVTEAFGGAETLTGRVDAPVAGATRLKVADNNKALPVDRVYFNYNHYHNALDVAAIRSAPGGTTVADSLSVERFTFGVEKTFLDEVFSLEVRVPFVGENSFFAGSGPLPAGAVVAYDGSQFGNVSLILKGLLYADDLLATSAGLGVEFPSGDDARTRIGSYEYTIDNEALHLHPYLAVQSSTDGNLFFHGFAQLDVATGSNTLRSVDVTGTFPGTSGNLGNLRDQTLLHLDLGGGVWLWQDDDRDWLTGVAGLLELHYTASLQSTDVVRFSTPGPLVTPGDRAVLLANRRGDFSVLNLTTGLHVELDEDTLLRVAVAMPLLGEDDRFFDVEPMVQLTRRY